MDAAEYPGPNECYLVHGRTAWSAQFTLFSAVAATLIYKW
jgi:hypothetical protein